MVWTTRVNYSLVVSYPRDMNMSIFARTYGCSEPIAGYLPRLSLVVLLNTTEHFALPLIQIEVDVSESHVPNGI